MKTITLPTVFAHAETIKVVAFDSVVRVEGGDRPVDLAPGESASWVAVVTDAGRSAERRRWERSGKEQEPGCAGLPYSVEP